MVGRRGGKGESKTKEGTSLLLSGSVIRILDEARKTRELDTVSLPFTQSNGIISKSHVTEAEVREWNGFHFVPIN
jgi:hypothetical protein